MQFFKGARIEESPCEKEEEEEKRYDENSGSTEWTFHSILLIKILRN
jgi:hypothetical protein